MGVRVVVGGVWEAQPPSPNELLGLPGNTNVIHATPKEVCMLS
jgi:hypothetical protein